MSVKSILRFFIGFCIAVGIFSIAAPFAHIPRSQMFPPFFAYPSAKGRAVGVVTKRINLPTSAWFRQGDHDTFIEYAFSAKAPDMLGGPPMGKVTKYKGSVQVLQEDYDKVKDNQQLPIKYDLTNPEINGIAAPWGGRSTVGGSRVLSGWVLWFFGMVAVGYMLAPLIERVVLRENY